MKIIIDVDDALASKIEDAFPGETWNGLADHSLTYLVDQATSDTVRGLRTVEAILSAGSA